MGYSITIGEGVMRFPSKKEMEEYGENHIDVSVDGHSEEDAPTFPGDGLTGKGNSRHPSYTQWSGFCERTGLKDLFFSQDSGLMRQHPGTFALCGDDLKKVKAAVKLHKAMYGKDLKAGCCECDKCQGGFGRKNAVHEAGFIETQSYDRVRLVWLEWWMNWALKNCKNPSIRNT